MKNVGNDVMETEQFTTAIQKTVEKDIPQDLSFHR